MSVFSFGKSEKVWGLRRSITMAMIEWWIGVAGPKPYLLTIQQSFEHGINHGDLEIVSDEDKAELRDMVGLMLEIGFETTLVESTEQRQNVRRQIVDLFNLIEGDLTDTRFGRRPQA